MRVITFSRFFPKGHPKAGRPTYFVEKMWKGLNESGISLPVGVDGFKEDVAPKWHTIRAGNRWKVGDEYSPRVWSGKPYASKQIEFAPPITIRKIWEFGVNQTDYFIRSEGGAPNWVTFDQLTEIAKNDGLERDDFECWFALHPKKKDAYFTGQILCHNPEINY